MFKCEKCKRITKPREKQYKITTLSRPKTYFYESNFRGKKYSNASVGEEIVKEISVCERCAEKYDKV